MKWIVSNTICGSDERHLYLKKKFILKELMQTIDWSDLKQKMLKIHRRNKLKFIKCWT